MRFTIPAWLDYDILLPQAAQVIHPFKRDHFFYFLDKFISRPSNNMSLVDDDDYVTFSSALFQKDVSNYSQYLKFLLDKGILEEPEFNRWKQGVSSKKYKLVYPEHDIDLISHEVSDLVLLRNHAKFLRQKRKDLKGLEYLTSWLDDLDIDYTAAWQHVQEKTNTKLLTGSRQVDKRTGKVKNPKRQRLNAMNILQKIRDKDVYKNVDGKGGRLHTNITSLGSDYRQFLLYKGLRLLGIDIKNSQPYLTIVLLNNSFWLATQKHYKQFWNTRLSTSGINNNKAIVLGETLQLIDKQELDKYQILVASGQLYKYFSTELSNKLNGNFSEDDAKLQMMIVMFSDNRFIGLPSAKPKAIFKQLFPGIYNLFYILKTQKKNLLACLLQQIESHLVLNVICKRLSIEHPHIPLFTIHDSILTTEDNIETVEKIMLEELETFVGYKPTLKIDNLKRTSNVDTYKVAV